MYMYRLNKYVLITPTNSFLIRQSCDSYKDKSYMYTHFFAELISSE